MGMWCRDEIYNYKLYNNLHCNIIRKCHHLAEIPTNKMKGRKRKQSIGLTSFYVQFKKKRKKEKRKKEKKKEKKKKETNKQQQQQKLSIKTGTAIVLQTIF